MKTIGGYLFFFGLGSILLHFFEMEFVVLSWIENWGADTAWGIRGAMIVIGAALWFFGGSKDAEASA
ncbi:MAG: hypothetical protein KDI71_23290 [Xanthomonadales bacterium]|nr:hypothetical protein [Xanthomonadales bacterium]